MVWGSDRGKGGRQNEMKRQERDMYGERRKKVRTKMVGSREGRGRREESIVKNEKKRGGRVNTSITRALVVFNQV